MKLLLASLAGLALALGVALEPERVQAWSTQVTSGFAASDSGSDYVTAQVALGEIRETIVATGSLQAVSTVLVSSQLSGQIAKLDADFNDSVATGQALAELDQRGFRARLVQAEAELAMARENVAILKARLDRAGEMEQEALAMRQVFHARSDQARVRLDAAERSLSRTDALAARGTASKSALEDAKSERDAAAATLREAQAVAKAHEFVVTSSEAARREAEAEISNAEAALPLREAAVALARLDLERSVIRAPIDGVVVGRNVEQGQIVAADLDAPVLFTIAGDLSAMEIHANIDETDIAAIAIGQPAAFTVDAFPGHSFPAKVKEVRKAALVVQGVVAYTAILEASNAEGLLLPGMTATVRIVVEEVGPLRTIPLAALRFTPEQVSRSSDPKGLDMAAGTVWVLDDAGRPRPRPVQLGADDGQDIAVLDSALSQGDQVIVGRIPRSDGIELFGMRF